MIARRTAGILLAVLMFFGFFSLAGTAQTIQPSPEAQAQTILQNANSWHTGDPVPRELRRSSKSESDLGSPMDSDDLISKVTNLSLLAALVVDPKADPECREDALSQGLQVGGPNRFFGPLRSQLSTAKAESIQPWVMEVRERIARPHAIVNALVIPYGDMSQNEALAVFARITGDLQRGVAWAEVYKRYSDEFSYPPDPKTGDRTKIGLLGRLVVFPDPELGKGHMATRTIAVGESHEEIFQWEGPPAPRRLFRLSFFDPAHLPTLLKADVGAVISLPSELHHEYVLYQVEETYKGDPEDRSAEK
jgi:hypothetical protein